MLDTVKLQKEERDRLVSKSYIQRTGLTQANRILDSKLIKIIVGPRRAGKSVFGFLLLKDKNFAYLNFDDENLLKIKDYDKLVSWLEIVYPKFKYVFFDEIQNLDKWELLINKMQRRGFNIVITGSNAKLLSGELASSLTGRYHQIEVWPLSFDEYKEVRKGARLSDYLFSGGYPEVIINNLDPKPYLETLFEAILLKDIVKRYNIRHSQKIYDLAQYLMTNFASVYSYHELKRVTGLSSAGTAEKYVSLLEQTYLFFSLNKFDYKLKNQFGYQKKIYAVDNGLVSMVGFQNSQNLGRLLENMVFVKLLQNGLVPNKDLFYYKTKSGKEIDFIIKKGLKITRLIQVCFDISDPKTKKREIQALLEASQELDCQEMSLITYNESEKIENGIKILKAEDF